MKRLIVALSTSAMVLLPVSSGMAAPKPAPVVGATCSPSSKIVKVGTRSLKCVAVGATGAWIAVTPVPKTIALGLQQFATWQSGLGVTGQADMDTAVTGADSVKVLLDQAVKDRDAKNAEWAAANGKAVSLQAEISGLPAAVSAANSARDAASAALAAPKSEADAALAGVNSLSSAYSSAMANQYASVGNTVLCTFGFTTCSSRPSTSSASNSLIISQYNAAKAKFDAAVAKYNSYYNDYKTKSDKAKALNDRQLAAQAEYNQFNAKAITTLAEKNAMDANVNRVNERFLTLGTLTSQLATFKASQSTLTASLAPDVLQSAPNWKVAYGAAMMSVGAHGVLGTQLATTWQKYATLAQ